MPDFASCELCCLGYLSTKILKRFILFVILLEIILISIMSLDTHEKGPQRGTSRREARNVYLKFYNFCDTTLQHVLEGSGKFLESYL